MKKSIKDFCSPWSLFSSKLSDAAADPGLGGMFFEEGAKEKGMRLVIGSGRSPLSGFRVIFYVLVDESDGVIADVKFQAFGSAAFIGIAEGTASLLIRMRYDRVARLSADRIEKSLRDKKEDPALPKEERSLLNLLPEALDGIAEQCSDIPLQEEDIPTPVRASSEETGPYPGFETLSKQEQLAILEEVIATEIRPYIELDEGGIDIVDWREGRDLIIGYRGACTTCYSSVGSTLAAISGIITAKVHPGIRVIPDTTFLRPN